MHQGSFKPELNCDVVGRYVSLEDIEDDLILHSCLSVNVFCAHAVYLQNSIEPPLPSPPPGRFDAVAAVRVPSPAPSGASPVPPSLSLPPSLSSMQFAVGVDYAGSARMRNEREKDWGRAVAALRFACSSEGSCVCVVDEEEEACSECQQIRKCLLSCLYSPTNVDMPFRSPSPWDCLTLYGERYCRPNYLVRGCRSGPVVSLGAPSAARTPVS